jgi:DNA-binding response OmpR family regulator
MNRLTPENQSNNIEGEADRQPKIIGIEAALRDAILEVAPNIATIEHIRQRVWPETAHPRHRDRLLSTASSLREKLRISSPPKKLINIRGKGYRIID